MSNTISGTVFNVPEAQGAERVELEATAATVQAKAPASSIAREVEANADHAKEAAHDAASTAQSKGPALTGSTSSAADKFKHEAKQKTNAAVKEGQRDVENAKAAGARYVDRTKALATSAISTAQSYLPTSVSGQPNDTTSSQTTKTSDIVSSLQSGASAALGTAKEYLAVAQESVQPHVEKAKGVAQGYLGTAGTQGLQSTPASSTGIPATSAPLESGPHTVCSPYPSATTASGKKVGQNESSRSVAL